MDPEDLLLLAEEVAALLAERHADGLRGNEGLRIEFGLNAGMRRVALFLEDPLSDRRLELFADLPGADDLETLHLGLDFLDGVLAEHLASDRQALPCLDPVPYQFEGRTVYLSGEIRRPGLEAAADALLAEAEAEGLPTRKSGPH
jgi:hypothetical protein